MIEQRVVKAMMSACLAVFALLVAFDNLADYGANFAFVRHVLSMDTVFPDNALRYRAILSPAVWHAAYALIILAEGLTGIAFAIGAVQLLRRLRAPAPLFQRAKRFVVIGAGLAFLLWFLGFMVVGGEWFAMWQSKIWNGQEAAFRFYLTVLAVAIFVNQQDRDIGT
ncbi:MAG TPA: DUF2165 domain-containing protein [Stellaceae bacterium]